jgi:hypothetical protein
LVVAHFYRACFLGNLFIKFHFKNFYVPIMTT